MKIGLWGAGSLGTILGAAMTRAGFDVELISRNASHVAGLKARGAQIRGTVNWTVPVRALLPGEVTESYDLVFLMTKQLDNKITVEEILPHLRPDGVICTTQNGLPELSVADVVSVERTFGCSIAWGATLIGDGVSELTSEPDSLTFGLGSFLAEPDARWLSKIQKVLECLGPVAIEKNFLGARWAKLLINCAFSGMSAVTGLTFGEVVRNKPSRRCVQHLLKECIDVAVAADIDIAPIQGKDIWRLIDYKTRFKQRLSFRLLPLLIRKHRRLKASMLQDLERGKKSEVDAINGVVVAFGKGHSVPTPYNELVCSLVHEIENGKIKPSPENLTRFPVEA